MGDPRLIEGCLEPARIHDATVKSLMGGQDELVSISAPLEAVDKRSLNGCQSEVIAKRNLARN